MLHGSERELWREEAGERGVLLSTAPPTAEERRLALAVVLVSAVIFIVLSPFARQPLAQVWAFVPIYQSALVVNDLITAALLFGHFAFLRSPSLYVLASGYLFTAFIEVAHALTFPGLFAPRGLLGAGTQTTAWLYMCWHGLFPLFVIGYAFLKAGDERHARRFPARPHAAILGSVVAMFVLVCGVTALATLGQEALPAIMRGNEYTPAMIGVVSAVWIFGLVALAVLWRRRPHSVLDLWLMVVMVAWLFDIALSAVLNGGRFDLGFYAGRIYGLLAASFVLIVLISEYGMLYGRLAQAHESERRERRRVQERTVELMAVNKELEAFSYSVSHDLRAPLRAIDGYAGMLEEESGGRLGDEGRRLLRVVRSSAHRMGRLIDDLLAFSRLGQQLPARKTVDTAQLAQEIAAELGREFPSAQISIGPLPPVIADRALLKQAWSNLIANALKYSGKRERPQIEIGARQEPAEDVFWVRDNGVGFDMRYAAKLFGVFQRLHRDEDFPGTGVGLAIVQRVITRHGGRVWAEAKPGEGACFYFSLPRKTDDPDLAAAAYRSG
jgi:signal transduction histidine kinase